MVELLLVRTSPHEEYSKRNGILRLAQLHLPNSGMSDDEAGHRSGELQRYREFAKSAADLALTDLVPLNEAIPEFAKLGHRLGQTEKRDPEMEKINVRNPSVLN